MLPTLRAVVMVRPALGPPRVFGRAELAVTPAAWSQGLSNRPPLAPDQAMLFVFPRDVAVPFTTLQMRMAMDLLFADAQGRVLAVHRALPAGSRTPWTAPAPFRFALETAAGGLAGVVPGAMLSYAPSLLAPGAL